MGTGTLLNGCARVIPLPGRRFGLLARDGVKVNGREGLPFQLLRDRDEIFAGGEFWCLSTKAAAAEAVFAAGKIPVRCARCLGTFQEGEAVSLCPCCRAQYHRADWAYDSVCAKCGHTTSGEPWVPDPLE
jgi:hypothetical protein